MNKTLSLLIICLTYNQITNASKEWVEFKQTYNKVYPNFEIEYKRNQIWEQNLRYIIKHNEEATKGKHSFRLDMNEFGDITHKEFVEKILLKKIAVKLNSEKSNDHFNDQDIPDSVDWRNCTPGVRNQGMCSADYAFTVTDSLAGIKCIKTKKLTQLSAQQILDCSEQDCEMGSFEQTYEYIIQTKGLDSETSYPFEGKPGTCRFKLNDAVLTINGYKNIISGNETDLTISLAKVGPIPTGINAGLPSFQFYRSGIYYDPSCNANIDHIFILTGYGSLGKDKDYYVAKNSWGTSWGDRGYILMSRNRNNNCGVASYASYGLVN